MRGLVASVVLPSCTEEASRSFLIEPEESLLSHLKSCPYFPSPSTHLSLSLCLSFFHITDNVLILPPSLSLSVLYSDSFIRIPWGGGGGRVGLSQSFPVACARSVSFQFNHLSAESFLFDRFVFHDLSN